MTPRRGPRPGTLAPAPRPPAEGLGEAVAAGLVLLGIIVLLAVAPDVDAAVAASWGRP